MPVTSRPSCTVPSLQAQGVPGLSGKAALRVHNHISFAPLLAPTRARYIPIRYYLVCAQPMGIKPMTLYSIDASES